MQVSRKDFTDKNIKDAYAQADGRMAKAAALLSELGHGKVSPQLARYWVSKLDSTELPEEQDRVKELAALRNTRTENNRLRRALDEALARVGTAEAFLDGVTDAVSTLNRERRQVTKPVKADPKGTPLTVEVLLSDLQIGKLSGTYNSDISMRRLKAFGEALLFQIKQKVTVGYNVERIILAIIGDIIESDKKHDNSARATDTGTAQQIHDATVGIYRYVIEPLAALGIRLDIIGVTGNHDWDGHGITQFRPGREQLSYPLYKALELLCHTKGMPHVTFDIPDGVFTTAHIYGQTVLYEHGVGVAVTEASMKAHKIKRSEQLGKYITFFRMGDKHNVCSFNSGQYVVNGAFFGSDNEGIEYSSIAGFSSVPAQWMGFHTPRDDSRFTLYDSFVIQLAHIN
ncbi:hypothetical protein [Burkholderia vietnamiensis]|uniref:hypothetical protein n=1 Tax=Burkholderia vietnamiensis TaxID=60552 RepID=UPI00159367E9|nr:hypothetical protein [Burkholderia vietnamiensis]MBR8006546.1 hypothetical protein [Burkholderia vietnamiensis]MDN7814708.1 hypothetical protein [Burkholderia vietnamiensis]MDN8042345.1 hypothetical protein [Burkholderia vietnamiensis]HDR9131354.1 hypothetical protein [Burkholderia vietnamiensis]